MEEYKYDIFVSYSKKDKNTVYEYYNILQEAGYNVWIDKDGLKIGAEYSTKIVKAIKQSKVFLFFSSKSSNDSAWTQGEVIAAHNYGKPIIPVILDGSPYAENIMLMMLPLNSIDCTQNSKEVVYEKLLATMKSLIGTGKGPEPVEPNTKTEATKQVKAYSVLAIVLSVIFSYFWLICSGEQKMNMSLGLFAAFISTLISSYASYLTITKIKGWNDRHILTNTALLYGFEFFLTYAIMALGLGFIDMNIMLLNITSSICAAFTCYVFIMLMQQKKNGYWLLWGCALLFSIGSIVWIGFRGAFLTLMILATILMAIFTVLLKLKKDNISAWDMLK